MNGHPLKVWVQNPNPFFYDVGKPTIEERVAEHYALLTELFQALQGQLANIGRITETEEQDFSSQKESVILSVPDAGDKSLNQIMDILRNQRKQEEAIIEKFLELYQVGTRDMAEQVDFIETQLGLMLDAVKAVSILLQDIEEEVIRDPESITTRVNAIKNAYCGDIRAPSEGVLTNLDEHYKILTTIQKDIKKAEQEFFGKPDNLNQLVTYFQDRTLTYTNETTLKAFGQKTRDIVDAYKSETFSLALEVTKSSADFKALANLIDSFQWPKDEKVEPSFDEMNEIYTELVKKFRYGVRTAQNLSNKLQAYTNQDGLIKKMMDRQFACHITGARLVRLFRSFDENVGDLVRGPQGLYAYEPLDSVYRAKWNTDQTISFDVSPKDPGLVDPPKDGKTEQEPQVRPRKAKQEVSFTIPARFPSHFDLGVALTGSNVVQPTFKAIEVTLNNPEEGGDPIKKTAIVRTKEEKLTGQVAFLLNWRFLESVAKNRLFVNPGLEVGASVEDKPGLFSGLSLTIGKYVRLGYGKTWQTVDTLSINQKEVVFLEDGTVDPDSVFEVKNDDTIQLFEKTRDGNYWSLSISLKVGNDLKNLFSKKEQK